MYGFDAMFDMNLNSFSDSFLKSDRSPLNVHRMSSNWRPIWGYFFKEFNDVQFVIHHGHDDIKLKLPPNARVEVGNLKEWTKDSDTFIKFVKYTIKDFQWVWDNAPNVLIWCALAGFILFWI